MYLMLTHGGLPASATLSAGEIPRPPQSCRRRWRPLPSPTSDGNPHDDGVRRLEAAEGVRGAAARRWRHASPGGEARRGDLRVNREKICLFCQHYANGDAWRLPFGAYEALCLLKDAGVKLAVVSNFDTRLRKLLNDLDVAHMFDAIIISSETGYEKPAAEIFRAALDQLGMEAGEVVHVGDDERADKTGANAIGIDCWLWGSDVKTFTDICNRVLISDWK
ncbi:uncharacterized protein LOC103720001 isoform X4 [Phoenix dactylifera]|uniref:Uncharacterized protein LOC103720001 isoform X4 n=1 Tax=Phoenix dactylifera TaxID=42345 RepID=A0A8B7MWS8_PHODC|nr:uncharacterized protein LOC103720001 isoform X4 [Phoenix dactylifera]